MAQELERFYVRILIQHVKGGTICYLYNREALDGVLGIEKRKFDRTQFISIGDTLTIEGRKYKVENINFKLEESLDVMDGDYGVNLHSPTDPTDFNCQIGVFVESLD